MSKSDKIIYHYLVASCIDATHLCADDRVVNDLTFYHKIV